MNLNIHTRNVELPEALRTYAEQKVLRLDRHFDRIVEARLELDVAEQKSAAPAKVAALLVHVQGGMLKGRVMTRDLKEAVDLVVDKVDQQLRKRKERLRDHKHSLPTRGRPAAGA